MNGRHVTAHFASFYLGWLGVEHPPTVALIRKWTQRGHVRRVGTDPEGYALYDLTDIIERARHRGLLDGIDRSDGDDLLAPESHSCHS